MLVVRVSWFEEKETLTKQVVAAEITESIVRNTGTDAKYAYAIFLKIYQHQIGQAKANYLVHRIDQLMQQAPLWSAY